MSIKETIYRHGLSGLARKLFYFLGHKSGYTAWRFRNAPKYANPTIADIESIESNLAKLGVTIQDYTPSPESFKAFQAENWFPADYHGGKTGGVWDEKLLEHWIASDKLNLMDFGANDIYVDVAAANSPWVKNLRERKGIPAFAIDIDKVGLAYRHLPYYRKEDATNTTFENASVKGASLHCAFEMFMKDDDTHLLKEAARILRPGCKMVILPLYMHRHYCAYATPEYFGKGYSDPTSKEYIRMDCLGVPSSRKYDAATLKDRILDPIESLGMSYQLLAIRNKAALGSNIYCHFILGIER